ncbi:MAG: hypothetical protein O7D86_03320 [Proteobacteria bacterium]|nr:hypothetical protein [Pseudomonadota bacterium]
MKQPSKELDDIVDVVLAYHPKKKKTKAHKKAVHQKTGKNKIP